MTQLPIETKVKSIHNVFLNSQAFVVPEYQRSYQWGDSQILSLIRDIHLSICSVAKSSSLDHEIRFLGSIITIVQNAGLLPNNYGSLQPNVFHAIVDGQQRLTTFSLLAAVLHNMLKKSLNDVVNAGYNESVASNLKKIIERYERQLSEVYTHKVQKMTKDLVLPAIIRAENDRWEDSNDSLHSHVARMLRHYVQHINTDVPIVHRGKDKDVVSRNIMLLHKLLEQCACGGFPKIDDLDDQEEPVFYQPYDVVIRLGNLLWYGDYPEIISAILHDTTEQNSALLKLTRLLIFTNVFLHRCYLNHVSTGDERWAFDMFIGLNTSGIPLSAVETFRAYLLQKAKIPNAEIVQQRIQELFIHQQYGIETYFDREKNANDRAKRIKEYVTAFALYMTGEKIGYNLHEQRMYLKKTYDIELINAQDVDVQRQRQIEFIQHMQSFTQYCVQHDLLLSQNTLMLPHLMEVEDTHRDTAMLALGFLSDVNHTIVHALLARYYDRVSHKQLNAPQEFVNMCRVVAAFFALWRPVRGTNGLPDIYRELMRSYISIKSAQPTLGIAQIKHLLRNKLLPNEVNQENLLDRSIWVREARKMRARRMKELTRFVLLMVSHQTNKDVNNPGLMQNASIGYQPYATLTHWWSRDLKSIEHIAPQKKTQSWDDRLYDVEDQLFDSLGNLVLMPTEINSSAHNNTWHIKWTYYQYLALRDQEQRKQFVLDMQQRGVVLQKSTIQLLNRATYAGHMDSIVAVGIDGKWDSDLVERRTTRMLEIFHDRMMEWLS